MKKYMDMKIIIAIIIMPIVVAILTSCIQSPIKNFVTSNDWIGFFGSYVGAILGGLITLFVMDKTIEAGNDNLKNSIKENKKLNKETETIRFCNDIANLIGEYCSDISVYYYECIRAEHYDYEKRNLYNRFRQSEITEEQYNHDLDILELNRPRGDRRKSTAIYFKIEILLKEEELAKTLMETLKKVHNTYDYVRNRLNSDENKFGNEIENLLEETRKFIKEYKSNN